MAKLKKGVRAKSAGTKSNADLQAKAEQVSKSIVDSAQQIWMAGMGAFNRAQEEGTKLFETLVKEGSTLEQKTRRLATGKVDAVRDAVENRVGAVKERAADTWDRLEKVFEDRVQRALTRLGVPGRDDLQTLIARVDALNAELRRLGSQRGDAPKVAVKAAPKPVPKPAPKPATVRAAVVARKPNRRKVRDLTE